MLSVIRVKGGGREGSPVPGDRTELWGTAGSGETEGGGVGMGQ